MARIYISHGAYDRELADRVKVFFIEKGHTVISKGEDSSVGAIRAADGFIAIITTPNVRKKDPHWDAIELASTEQRRRKKRFLFPFLRTGSSVPDYLKGISAVPFEGENIERALESNYSEILREIEPAPAENPDNSRSGENQNFRIGSAGGMVTKIQTLLQDGGFKIIADGTFGQQTANAVMEFQRIKGLPTTGEVDSMTWAMLNSLSKNRAQYEEIQQEVSNKADELIEQMQQEGEVQQQKSSKAEEEVQQQKVEDNEISQQKSDPKFWLLAFNLSNWRSDSLVEGEKAHYNSRMWNGEPRPQYELFSEVQPGDYALAYDFSTHRKVIGTFRVTQGLHANAGLGEILELEIEKIFETPVDVSRFDQLKSFLDQLSKQPSARLLKIHGVTYEAIANEGLKVVTATRAQLHSAAARLHSDDSDPEDQLRYETYAETIASIIGDREDSPPPLNIAIIAPWGQGKTTLMRYIKKRFPQREPAADSPEQHVSFGMLWQWFGASSRLVRWFKKLFHSGSSEEVIDQLREGIWKPQSLEHPTVWFNPWRYQSSEQIWAGLGHAMITQLVAKLDPIQREQFWLSLRLKRIDGNAIRRDIHKRLFESVLPVLVVGLMVAGLIVLAASFARFGTAVISGVSVVSGGSFIWGLYRTMKDFASKSLEGKFATYVREPNYQEKLGLFHEINEDLSKVCNELIDPMHPAIIFIDDLDRCSPKVVTEVIEAINLMMTSDFRNRCYFVFGMDAQMVSAALDAQYSNMAGKFADKEKIHGSVGWYFLDKFIQLPFFIPVLNVGDKKAFLNRFFFEKPPVKKEEQPQFEAKEIEADADAVIDNPEKREDIAKKYEGAEVSYQNAITRKLVEKSKDAPEIMQEVINYAIYLDGSPRGLKRFANLLRFYHVQQKKRMYEAGSLGTAATTKSLGKWLVINLRWPQMVRWVQWEYEEKLLHSADPEVKAKKIDDLINEVDKGDNGIKDPYQRWLKIIDPRGADGKEIQPSGAHLKWLLDRDLFLLLYENRHDDSTLEKALQYDVW